MATTRSTLTDALTPDEISTLVVTALIEASVGADVFTTYTTTNKTKTFPLITDDLAAEWVSESNPITLSDIGTGEVSVKPEKVVAATRISNEAIEDPDEDMSSVLGNSIARALAAKVDAALFGAVAAPAPQGLGALVGFTDAGTTDLLSVDALHDALAAVRGVGATPTGFVMSTASALRLSKAKEATGSKKSLLQADPAAPTVLQVAGVPFYVSRYVADDVIFAVDKSRLALVIRKAATVEVDRSVYALTRESLVLGEARVGAAVLHPASVARVTVSPTA